MLDILKKFHVHIPFDRLYHSYLELVLRKRIMPEISFNQGILDVYTVTNYRQVATALSEADLAVTFHAPFMDLRPGALDTAIRCASRDRIKQVLDLIPLFQPRTIVCHASYDHRYYVACDEEWLSASVETWTSLIAPLSETHTVIALENVYEREPTMLYRLLDHFSTPHLRFCLDTGHWNVFSRKSLEEWLVALGPYLGHVHVHDNHGRSDEHLPPGEGTFPFVAFFQGLRLSGLAPSMTIEAHQEDHLWRAVANLADPRIVGDVPWHG